MTISRFFINDSKNCRFIGGRTEIASAPDLPKRYIGMLSWTRTGFETGKNSNVRDITAESHEPAKIPHAKEDSQAAGLHDRLPTPHVIDQVLHELKTPSHLAQTDISTGITAS